MTKRSYLPIAALVVALAVLVSFGGVAVAKGKVIGKNLVVTKSIKKGAVTGDKIAADAIDASKVKDGSLTAADLAPGTIPTIPAPTNGKAAAFGSVSITTASGGAKQVFTPFGAGSPTSTFGALAPTPISVADLHVLSALESGAASISVSLVTGPDFSSIPDGTSTLLTCTVPTGSSTCSSGQTATIPAGNVFWLVATNGPFGSNTTFVAASYTMKVQ